MVFVVMQMDLEIIILSKVIHTEKGKYHDIAYMWNLKKDTNELIYITNISTQKQTYNYQRVKQEEGSGINQGFGLA